MSDLSREKLRILLVEDVRADAELFQEAVQEFDSSGRVEVFLVGDGFEAMQFLRRAQPYEGVAVPDLIFLDLNLPGMDGRELLREIKESEAYRHLPLLILTTSRSPEDILTSYRHHANCYLAKTLDFSSFKKLVADTLLFWSAVVEPPTLS